MSTKSEQVFLESYAPFTGLRLLDIGAAAGQVKRMKELAQTKEYVTLDMRETAGVDIVHNLHEPLDVPPFDVITLFSVLEHCKYPWKMAENVEKLLKKGGLLLMSAPFQWRVHAYPDDYYRFTPHGIEALFTQIEWLKEELDPATAKLDRHEKGSVLILKSGRKV